MEAGNAVSSMIRTLAGGPALALCGALLAALAVSACTSEPRYPIDPGQAPGRGAVQVRPRYSKDGDPLPPETAPTPPPRRGSASAAPSRDSDAPRTAPTGGVDSRPLGASAAAGRRAGRPAGSSQVASATMPVLSPSQYADGQPRPPVLTSPGRITVGAGESVFDVAERYRVPVRALIEANDLQPPYALVAGTTLTIPPPMIYVVQEGDTLFGVARRFNIDPRSLASLNDITLEAALGRGRQIALPSLARDQGVNPQASGPSPVGSTLGRAGAATTAGAGLRGETYAKPAPPPRAGIPPSRGGRNMSAHSAEDAQEAVANAAAREGGLAAGGGTPTGPVTDAQVIAAGRGRFVAPIRGELIEKFGSKGVGQRNDGVNIAAPQGTPVKAAAAGEVAYAGSAISSYGNLVLIKHAGGWVTAYAHLDTISVKMRGQVLQGIPIGTVGQSGGVDRPQLHFEIRFPPQPDASAKPIDPALLLPNMR